MTQEKIRRLLDEQLAIDYGCSVCDFERKDTIVTEQKNLPLSRIKEEQGILSMLSYKGKLVISAAPELLEWSENVLANRSTAEWCFEAGSLISIDRKLQEFGYEIDKAHLFFTPKFSAPAPSHEVRLLSVDDISKLRADERIDEAFLFEDYIEDVLGAAVYDESGELLAVAGATANSDRMWEIGVNSFYEGKGYAVSALSALTREILSRGIVPFYGTALSHLASQNTALKAGFAPSFCELTTRRS